MPDPAAALAEVRRVLVPGGELRFWEHVRSRNRAFRAVQRSADRLFWTKALGGCRTTRDTEAAIRGAGFRIETIERGFHSSSVLTITSAPYVLGIARPSAMRLVVLLRGVNLARNRRLAMADLRSLLHGLGYDDAVTHLQSGNAVLTSRKKPASVKRELERALAGEHRLETEVFVRTREELAKVVTRDPLGNVATNPSRYLVSFLSGKPPASFARDLDAALVAPEQAVVSGRELYSWHPDGLQRSKVMSLLGRKDLGVTATSRNWNTVTKLLELADG